MQAIAWKAQTRLCRRFRRMLNQGRPRNLVVAAIARELCGFIWAIGQAVAQARAPDPPGEITPGERTGEMADAA